MVLGTLVYVILVIIAIVIINIAAKVCISIILRDTNWNRLLCYLFTLKKFYYHLVK